MNWTPHLERLPRQARNILRITVYGLGAGASTVLFQLGIAWLYRGTLVRLSAEPTAAFLLGSLGVILSSALAVGWLLNSFCPEAAGSGIPQLKAAFWKDFGFVPWRIAWVKFLAGVLSIGGGSSLGREGPSVQLAGAVGSNLAGLLGEPKQGRRLGAAAGAAAGLAAAFNTPLAAVTFVLEEIVQDLNSRLLGGVLLASVLGAFVVHAVIGKQPAFDLASAEASGWLVYAWVPVVAALAALLGILFQRLTLRVRDRCRQGPLGRWPAWLRPAVAALLTWVIGVTVFHYTGLLGVFSLGYDDLSAGLTNRLTWQVAGVLLAGKLAATILCYGFGGCGGIFSPTLFFGGMCGLLLGALAAPLGHMGPPDQVLLAVVGMSACLGAVVRAPITGILIVFEMTHEFALVPPLMVGALVSQGVARLLARRNFYDAILEQDGHDVERVRPPRDLTAWQQWPVSAIANFHPVALDQPEPAAMERLLRLHPYKRFPVLQAGRPIGILTRADAEAARAKGRSPRLSAATTCPPDATIREAQRLLVESATGVLLLVGPGDGRLVGLVTLHDLVRAQMALSEGEPASR